ncbi:MAG TPA: HD domain-containing phosphohydrolase [Chloroflexia bacterium]|nr:HD domain-containing phosphohydrolase [Chloroflexia bacterium]
MTPEPRKHTVYLPSLSGGTAFARLSRLYEIVRSLASITELDRLLNQIVASTADMLEAHGAALLLAENESGNLKVEVTSGRNIAHFKNSVLSVDDRSVEGRVAQIGEPCIENLVEYSSYLFGQAGQLTENKARKLVCVPLKVQERVTGVLEVLDKNSGKDFNEEDVKLLEALADTASVAIENVRLYEEEKRQAQLLTHAYEELQNTYKATLQALTGLLDLRDDETHGHSLRVVAYTLRLAQEMGIDDPERLRNMEQGALLHDVGKVGVADSVLRKTAKLDDIEWMEMKGHPELGYRMLKDIDFLKEALTIVRYHHERWNGSGYPKGLKGEQIPLDARIFAVIDAFDAITSDRPYSRARSYEQATEIIIRDSGVLFDPQVVEAFLRVPRDEWQEIREQIASTAKPR